MLGFNQAIEALEGVGVGFFINHNMVVSCAHNFPELKSKTKDEVKDIIFHGQIFDGQQIILRVIGFSDEDEYDCAVFHTEYRSNNFLTVGPPKPTETRLAITSFGIGLTKALMNQSIMSQNFIVIQGTLVNFSPHHIVYSSNLFSGDSGGAVICASDGTVIGIHLQTVNEANEKLENKRLTMKVINESVNSLLCGLSQGFVGLRLDSDVLEAVLSAA
jgi:hypothetical protein